MASTPESRQLDERAEHSARFGLSRASVLTGVAALAVAMVAAGSFVLVQLAGWRTTEHPAIPGFLATALGAPQADAPLVRKPAAGVAVTIDETGFKVTHRDASLGVSSDGDSSPWTTFEHGAVRATPYGSETIAVERTKTEQYLTVVERQGRKTWRWRLDTQTLEPRLRVDGGVELLAHGANSGITILPAAILDLEGRNVTPASTRWSLDRDDRGWLLELDLDDSELPLPYVIDPASAYPSPLELRSTTTSETGSWDLDNATGAVNTTTDNIPARNATGWYAFNPGLSNTTQLTSLPTSTDGQGWLVDPAGGATGFPAGTWSFTVRTDIPNATLTAGTAVMTIGVWKGTVSGGVFTPTGTILTPTDDPAAQNIRPNVNTGNFTVSYFLPKISLAVGETLFVDYWRHQTANINTNTATQRQLDFYVNDGNAQITHPAADDAGPTHSLSLAPGATGALYAAGRLYYKSDAAGSFALRDALTDTAGTGTAASGVLDLDYPVIATSGWTHNAETVIASPNYQSSTYSWTTSPSNPADQTLTAEDNALQQSTLVVAFVADATAPTGGELTVNSLDATAGGTTSITTGASVTIGTRTDWTETQGATASGLATSTLTREDGTLSGNVCSGFGAPATITGNPNQTGLTTGCYRFTLTGTDNLGNAASITTTVKVDTSAPTISGTTVGSVSNTADSYASGASFYYRPAGSGGTFAVDVAASDGESGLGDATFPALAGGFTPTSAAGIAPPSPYSRTYTWPATTSSESGSKTVLVANNAAGSTTTNGNFAIVADSTAPTGGVLTVNGVAATGGGTASYDTDGSFTVGARTDHAETLSATAAGLRSSTLTREDGTLSADSCSSYGGPVTLVGTPAQNGFTTGCYRYTLEGVDNVGNTVTVSTVVKVDTTAPTSAADALSTYATSTSITVGYSATDAATGVDSVQLWVEGPGAGGYALVDTDTSPASPSFSFTAADGDGTYRFYTRARDNAGNTEAAPASEDATTVADTTNPVSAADALPAFTGTTSIAVTYASSDTGGSGVDEVELWAKGPSDGAYVLADTDTTPGSASFSFTASEGQGTYRFYTRARDVAGNTEAAPGSEDVVTVLEMSPPTAPSLSFGSFTNASATGTTVYVREGASGGFTSTADAADPDSGVTSHAYPTFWGEGGSVSSDPAATAYTFGTSDTAPAGAQTVTATNGAGLTGPGSSFTVVADTLAPVTTPSPVPAANGNGWHTASPVSVTLGALDGGAGVKEIRYTTDGSAPGPTSPLYAATIDIVAPGTTTLTFRAEDNVGNLEAPATLVVQIDTTAPTTPTLAYSGLASASYDGTVVWFRPGVAGGFTVTPSASDPESSVAAHAFPAFGAAGWSNTGGTYAFTAAAADPVEPNEVVTTNGAGLASAGAPVTVTADSTAPVSAATCNAVVCLAGWYTAKPVTVVLTASDAQSGLDEIAWSTDGSAPANEYLGPLSLGAEGTTTVRFASRDNVGNVETPVAQDVRIDTVGPAAAMGAVDPYLRDTVALTSTQSDATSGIGGVQFQIAPAATGAWTNVPDTWDTSGTANGQYDVRVRVTDVAGNVTDSAPVASRWVDNLAPTITLDAPASAASGSVTLTSTPYDAHSGVDTVEYEYSAAGAGVWRTTALTGALWDTTQLADGLYDLRARATDRSGNSAWSTVNGILVDNNAPSVSLTAPADASFVNAAAADPLTMAASASDAGSGVASVEFLACTTTGPACASWTSVALDTTPAYTGAWTLPADGERIVRAVATDQAGHTAEAVVTVTVDRTAPAASLTAPSAGANARATIPLTASAADATSGVTSVDFQRSPAGASSWTTVASDTDGGDGWSSSLDTTLGSTPDGLYDLRVLVADRAGNTQTHVAANVRIDNTAPTGTLADPGQYLRSSLALSGSAADAGSGVASVAFQRSPESAGTWTTIGTDTNGGDGWSTTFDTTSGGTPDGRYDLRILVTDEAGNTHAHALTGRTIDNTKPTASIADPGANLRLTAALGGTAEDVTAGVLNVTFEYDNGGGWQLISTDTDGSDGWSATLNTTLPATPDGLYAFRLTATDRAGNQETSQIGSRRIDNTAPTASVADPGPYLMGAEPLSASAADGGSGIDAVRFERSPAGSGGPWTQVGPDASFVSGAWRTTWNTSPDGLYDLRVVVDDVAGNRTSDGVASRRVDNTAPVTTDNAAPGRHNTDQTVTLSRTDAGSGPSATQYRVRPPGGSFGAWQSGTSVTIVASAGDGVYTIEYFSTDAAGNVESVKSTDVLIDTTGPSGTVTDPSTFLRGLVTLTATADDPTDVSSVTFEYAPEGTSAWTQIGTDLMANGSDEYTVDWDTTAVADIAYDLQVTFLDSVGNPTVRSLTGKTVDNELPAIALTAPAAGAVKRNVIAITADAADGVSGMREVRFEVKPAGAEGFSQVDVDNGSSPYSTSWDSTGSPDGPTDLRVIAVDAAGNLRSATTTIFVDNNAPTLAVSAPSTAVSGTVTLTATGSSDIQSVTFKVGGAAIGTDADGSDGFFVVWSTAGDGNRVVTAEATDVGGNVGTSSPVTVQVDNTDPTGSMTTPGNGATVSGTIAVAARASDAGSGVSGTSFEFKPTSDSTWTPIGGSSWNTTAVATGAYNLRARITDNAGNTVVTAAITVQVVPPPPAVVPPAPPAVPPTTPGSGDPAPSILASTPADGSTLAASPASIDVTASEPLSAVTGLTLNGTPVGATVAGTSLSLEPGELATGAYTLAGTLVDRGGKAAPFRLHFTVVTDSPATLPYVEANVPTGTATSLTAADGASAVIVPAGAVNGGSDWLVVRIQPLPASSVPQSPAGVPATVVEVTARWALAGTEVHTFLAPLEIILSGGSAAAVPATAENGAWRQITPIANGGTLAAGSRDGWFREGGTVHILTRHLSVFGLVEGVEPPQHKLVVGVAAAKTFSWSTRQHVAVRLKLSQAASVVATLHGKRGRHVAAWHLKVKAGTSIARLRMPRRVRTPGAYRLVVTAAAGGQTARRALALRIVRNGSGERASGRVDVALAGEARLRRSLALRLDGRRLVSVDGEAVFDVVASTSRDVRVVVVDVDRHGTGLVRDLRTVFPTLRLLALASRTVDLRGSRRAGADAALRRNASPARVAQVIRALAGR